MAFFFATPDDLLPLLLSIEARHRIAYTLMGHIHHQSVESFRTARDLPTLFAPAPYESAVLCPTYLVTDADTAIVPRPLSPYDGKERWAIDQLYNPDSTALRHGGFYGEKLLLNGEVRTAHKSPTALRLQRAFDSVIRKHFTKIRAFYVGKQAEALLDSGYRLTGAEQSPPEYDLRR